MNIYIAIQLGIILTCVIIMFWTILVMKFKIGYYEQTFKNNKDLFTSDRYAHIEKVMKAKTPFVK